MSTSRSYLHKNKLADFEAFCLERGWAKCETKSPWEVLRMTHRDAKHPLIVYKRLNGGDHLTTHGVALNMAMSFVDERKQA